MIKARYMAVLIVHLPYLHTLALFGLSFIPLEHTKLQRKKSISTLSLHQVRHIVQWKHHHQKWILPIPL